MSWPRVVSWSALPPFDVSSIKSSPFCRIIYHINVMNIDYFFPLSLSVYVSFPTPKAGRPFHDSNNIPYTILLYQYTMVTPFFPSTTHTSFKFWSLEFSSAFLILYSLKSVLKWYQALRISVFFLNSIYNKLIVFENVFMYLKQNNLNQTFEVHANICYSIATY